MQWSIFHGETEEKVLFDIATFSSQRQQTRRNLKLSLPELIKFSKNLHIAELTKYLPLAAGIWSNRLLAVGSL